MANESCHQDLLLNSGTVSNIGALILACVNMTVEQHVLLRESYIKYGSSSPGENYIVNFPGSQFHEQQTFIFIDLCTGCGRKNSPIWEGHSFGWGARRRTAVYVPFSVYTMVWSGEHRAFIVEEFIKKFIKNCDIGWPLRSPDMTPCDFFLWGYLKAKVYEQRPQKL